jgi:hypothetical protein
MDASGEVTNFSLTFDVILLKRTDLMMNAAADGDIERYFVNFRFAMQLVISYLDIKTRTALQADMDDFEKQEEAIKMAPDLNPETKRGKILALKQSFADKHAVYIFSCFSRVGIVRIKEEGRLDFRVLDIQQMAQIVQGASGGLPSAIKRVLNKDEVEGE